MNRLAMLMLCFGSILLLQGCNEHQSVDGPRYSDTYGGKEVPIYRIAIHPLFNPKMLLQSYAPLAEFLDNQIPDAHFVIEASRDYQVYESKFRGRDAEFLLPNPWHTLEAMKNGYEVIAMAGDKEDFKGIFLVRKDSPIRTMSDLKGRKLGYPSHTALAACIMPQYLLHQNGLDVLHDIQNVYVGSQESAIKNVLLGLSDVGVTWPPPWRKYQKDYPEEAAQLKVIWETEYLMNNSFMVRNDVPQFVREKVRSLLLSLDKSADGRKVLARMETARFLAANDKSYEPVRKFIQRFEKEVRPVEQKK